MIGMLRRITVLLMAVLLLFALTGNVALALTEPDLSDRGQPNADEEKKKGKPNDPNAWGSVASQLGDAGVMGAHSSDPLPTRCVGVGESCGETPRNGLGNEARNDAEAHGVTGSCSDTVNSKGEPVDQDNCDTGDHMADHACQAAAGGVPGTNLTPSCTAEPGNSPDPEPGS
jgi:hypothetical protein